MKKNKLKVVILTLTMFLLQGCSNIISPSYINSPSSNHNLNGKLTLNGSTSMTRLCNSLAEEFSKLYPDIHVEKSDTGSGAAVGAVLSGNSLIGDLSRELNDEEKSDSINAITIAYDGIAVIVNKDNPINNLSYSELQDIFTKKITNWSQLSQKSQRITLVGREEASGTRDGFESALNIVSKTKYDVQYQENGDIISKVTSDPSAIGYCSLFSVSGNVKAISVDNISPSDKTILSKEYKITRPFIEVYSKNKENELINLWFEFIKSDMGKDIIIKQGLVPAYIS